MGFEPVKRGSGAPRRRASFDGLASRAQKPEGPNRSAKPFQRQLGAALEGKLLADSFSQRLSDHDLRWPGGLHQPGREVDHLAVVVAMERDRGASRQANP